MKGQPARAPTQKRALRGVSRVTLFLLLMVFPTVAILKPRPPCSYTIFTARVKE